MRLLIAVSFIVLAACSQGDAKQGKDAKDAKAAPPPVAVSVIEATIREVPITFEAVGRTEGSREVQVRARVAGIIERQLYTEGDAVKAGATLFEIERAPFEIELAQARGTLAEVSAREELAGQEHERLKSLADKRAISQKEADQAASAVQQARALAQVARARVRQAELNLSYTRIAAPIDGVTGRALQSIGSLVSPGGEAALLTTLTQSDPLWVRFSLSEPEFAQVRGGEGKEAQVKIELADGTAYPEPAKLNFSGSTVDAQTSTVQMRAEVPNPRLALLPGQFVRVRVTSGSVQAVVVPQSAVLQNEGGRFVWIAAEGKAMQRPIKAGAWVGKDWAVLEGLKPGDQVIVDNLVRMRPNAPVAAKKAGQG
ncbi:MAG: rane fusion protein multidrug efflux system [Betaproteobacteria bacterium]|jgi:membrane fusion protein (multidrug efflux system)|nr:rane fusion protein multidrug efflux system [Betaproteobacteria bacterium]